MAQRISSKAATLAAAADLAIAALCIGYELSIRLFDRGNSEFAGMLSFALTLPSALAIALFAGLIFGVHVGDSDAAFVVILGLAALANAGIIFAIGKAMRRG